MRLALGTVQLGLDYGISNARGRVPEQEAFAILDRAVANGVRLFDTAAAYGNSEAVLGRWLRSQDDDLLLVSKLLPSPAQASPAEAFAHLTARFEESVRVLGRPLEALLARVADRLLNRRSGTAGSFARSPASRPKRSRRWRR